MEELNGVCAEDKGGPPPPSPLTGCYLLIVVGEPQTEQHKDIILQKVAKGLLSWNFRDCLVDLEKELNIITEQGLEGEEARYGERLIQFASENLVTEILIHPAVNTLQQCIRNLLSSFTKHRQIIHAGYTFQANGSWSLQDGTFSYADFAEAFQELEVQRVTKAYENSITLDIHCSAEGEWPRLPKEPFAKACKVRINPTDVLTTGSPSITDFINYLSPFLIPTSLESILESSDVVGNIRFCRPTLYVFPGGQGDAALFGINGFNMLLDGGYSRKACFWDFVRHLDRLDAVLLTRLNNSSIGGISSVLKRKTQEAVYPQIGHFFCNIQERRSILSPDGDKDRDPLLVNLVEEGQNIIQDLKHLNLTPQFCYRDSDPIILYHKVGHGTLNMYVLSPDKNSREVREFLYKWNSSDQKLFATPRGGKEYLFPLQNLVSICALLVWQPSNPNDTITRILYPGSTPQKKVFEGFDRLKALEYIKHPVCSERSLAPIKKGVKKEDFLDKIISSNKEKKVVENKHLENGEKITENGDVANKDKQVKKSDSVENGEKTKSRKSVEEHTNNKILENGSKAKPKIDNKNVKSSRAESQGRKKPASGGEKKGPSTPKKILDNKLNGESKDKLEKAEKDKQSVEKDKKPLRKPSPSATPAKSTKDANNRKVVEEKKQPSRKEAVHKAPKEDVKESKEPKTKVERKPISRRPKTAKAPSSPMKKLSNGVQKPDSLGKRGKLDKEGTTDSSTVSTPSADQESVLKKDLSKMTPEEIQQIKEKEFKEQQEEQEAVKEIEAVFRKGEGKATDVVQEDSRKIKDVSIDNKLETEEYLIIEKEEIEHTDEIQKLAKDSQETEKQRKQSDEKDISLAQTEKEDLPTEKEETQTSDFEKAEINADDAAETKKLLEPVSDEKLEMTAAEKKELLDEEPKEILESHPEEKISANIESGATTTAPTLPEDERITLDEIKEDINLPVEEKQQTEETKEKEQDKEVPKIELPPTPHEQQPKLPPTVAGIKLDRSSHIRDIVKTPDEVADLPMHEEADFADFARDEKKINEKVDEAAKEKENIKKSEDLTKDDENKANVLEKSELETKEKHDINTKELETKEKRDTKETLKEVIDEEWVVIPKEDKEPTEKENLYEALKNDLVQKAVETKESEKHVPHDVVIPDVTKKDIEVDKEIDHTKLEEKYIKDTEENDVNIPSEEDKKNELVQEKDMHDDIETKIEKKETDVVKEVVTSTKLKTDESKDNIAKDLSKDVDLPQDLKEVIEKANDATPSVEEVKEIHSKIIEDKITNMKDAKDEVQKLDDKIQELKESHTSVQELNLDKGIADLTKIEKPKEVQEVVKHVEELAVIDDKLQKLKEEVEKKLDINNEKKDISDEEEKKLDNKTEKRTEEIKTGVSISPETAEKVRLPDSSPEEDDLKLLEKLKDIDKAELGRKSPQEREGDVEKIVAGVAEVLKSEVPMEILAEKLPFGQAFTQELRETHITTQDSSIIESRVIENISTIQEVPEEVGHIQDDEDEKKDDDKDQKPSKKRDLIAESKELLSETSKIISGIQKSSPDTQDSEDVGTVHRMLVTASSEDGGEEIEICPPGTITFSKSSESSGRSSPDPSAKTSHKSSVVDTMSDTLSTVKQVASEHDLETLKNKIKDGTESERGSGKSTPELEEQHLPADIAKEVKSAKSSGKSSPESFNHKSRDIDTLSSEKDKTKDKDGAESERSSRKSTPELVEQHLPADISKEVESAKSSEKSTPKDIDALSIAKEKIKDKDDAESEKGSGKSTPELVEPHLPTDISRQVDSAKLSGKSSPDPSVRISGKDSGKVTPELIDQHLPADISKEVESAKSSGKSSPEDIDTLSTAQDKIKDKDDAESKKGSGKSTPELVEEHLPTDISKQVDSPKISGKSSPDPSVKISHKSSVVDNLNDTLSIVKQIVSEHDLETVKDKTKDEEIAETEKESGKNTPELADQNLRTDISKEVESAKSSGKSTTEPSEHKATSFVDDLGYSLESAKDFVKQEVKKISPEVLSGSKDEKEFEQKIESDIKDCAISLQGDQKRVEERLEDKIEKTSQKLEDRMKEDVENKNKQELETTKKSETCLDETFENIEKRVSEGSEKIKDQIENVLKETKAEISKEIQKIGDQTEKAIKGTEEMISTADQEATDHSKKNAEKMENGLKESQEIIKDKIEKGKENVQEIKEAEKDELKKLSDNVQDAKIQLDDKLKTEFAEAKEKKEEETDKTKDMVSAKMEATIEDTLNKMEDLSKEIEFDVGDKRQTLNSKVQESKAFLDQKLEDLARLPEDTNNQFKKSFIDLKQSAVDTLEQELTLSDSQFKANNFEDDKKSSGKTSPTFANISGKTCPEKTLNLSGKISPDMSDTKLNEASEESSRSISPDIKDKSITKQAEITDEVIQEAEKLIEKSEEILSLTLPAPSDKVMDDQPEISTDVKDIATPSEKAEESSRVKRDTDHFENEHKVDDKNNAISKKGDQIIKEDVDDSRKILEEVSKPLDKIKFEKCEVQPDEYKTDQDVIRKDEKQIEDKVLHMQQSLEHLEDMTRSISFEKCEKLSEEFKVDKQTIENEEKQIDSEVKQLEKNLESVQKLEKSISFEKCEKPNNEFKVDSETIKKGEKQIDAKVLHIQESVEQLENMSKSVVFEKCDLTTKEIKVDSDVIEKDKEQIKEKDAFFNKSSDNFKVDPQTVEKEEKLIEQQVEQVEKVLTDIEKLEESVSFDKCSISSTASTAKISDHEEELKIAEDTKEKPHQFESDTKDVHKEITEEGEQKDLSKEKNNEKFVEEIKNMQEEFIGSMEHDNIQTISVKKDKEKLAHEIKEIQEEFLGSIEHDDLKRFDLEKQKDNVESEMKGVQDGCFKSVVHDLEGTDSVDKDRKKIEAEIKELQEGFVDSATHDTQESVSLKKDHEKLVNEMNAVQEGFIATLEHSELGKEESGDLKEPKEQNKKDTIEKYDLEKQLNENLETIKKQKYDDQDQSEKNKEKADESKNLINKLQESFMDSIPSDRSISPESERETTSFEKELKMVDNKFLEERLKVGDSTKSEGKYEVKTDNFDDLSNDLKELKLVEKKDKKVKEEKGDQPEKTDKDGDKPSDINAKDSDIQEIVDKVATEVKMDYVEAEYKGLTGKKVKEDDLQKTEIGSDIKGIVGKVSNEVKTDFVEAEHTSKTTNEEEVVKEDVQKTQNLTATESRGTLGTVSSEVRTDFGKAEHTSKTTDEEEVVKEDVQKTQILTVRESDIKGIVEIVSIEVKTDLVEAEHPSKTTDEKEVVKEDVQKTQNLTAKESDIKNIVEKVSSEVKTDFVEAEYKGLVNKAVTEERSQDFAGKEDDDKNIVKEISSTSKADVDTARESLAAEEGRVQKVLDLQAKESDVKDIVDQVTSAVKMDFVEAEYQGITGKPLVMEKGDGESMEKQKLHALEIAEKSDAKKLSISDVEIGFKQQTDPKDITKSFLESEKGVEYYDESDSKIFKLPEDELNTKKTVESDASAKTELKPSEKDVVTTKIDSTLLETLPSSSSSLQVSYGGADLSGKSSPDMSGKSTAPVSPSLKDSQSTEIKMASKLDSGLSEQTETDDEDLSTRSQVAQSDLEEMDQQLEKLDPMSMSFYGALPDETDSFLELPTTSTYLYEITKAKYSVKSKEEEEGDKFLQERDVMSASFIGDLPAPTGADVMTSSFIGTLPESSHEQPKSKDVVDQWGKPLGLPAPSYHFEEHHSLYSMRNREFDVMSSSFIGELPSVADDTDSSRTSNNQDLMNTSVYFDQTEDPIAAWGKPLGLPSPAPPNNNSQGTPKKEKKVSSNVANKNKLNDDKRRAESPSKTKNKKCNPVYVDLTYVPHHGNHYYSYVDFFRRIRARYYVFSGLEPSRQVYDALLEAKQTWEDKELEVTIIPTYDTDILGYWVAENEDLLAKAKIDLSPSASRCTINLQDHETSCAAYRLEF